MIKIGYVLDKKPKDGITILNTHFRGFDLLTLAKDMERLPGPYADPPIAREVSLSNPPPVIRIEYKSGNYLDEGKGLYISRTFRYEQDELTVYHELPSTRKPMAFEYRNSMR